MRLFVLAAVSAFVMANVAQACPAAMAGKMSTNGVVAESTPVPSTPKLPLPEKAS